ncbi:hypothetical protein STAS_00253 [Striga asiatica]|uniref:Uncharacterized protein n=1 Tax=Striga asiatica TaxID=4170 RepID=A0A5A7NW41_STRAF|nr:hypothetical protein STAS_00253 [Striga asiatica]
MKKSPHTNNSRKLMEPRLTDPEIDAALQLIQLSGDSAARTADHSREESVGDSHEISSNLERAINGELEWLPRRKKRFRSIDDVYSATRPLIKKRGKKSIDW